MELTAELERFWEATGLKVNYDKTNIYRIGCLADSDAMIYTTKPFNRMKKEIVILGIQVSNEQYKYVANMNLDPILEKVYNTCKTWKRRGLMLMGKIRILNLLVA